MKSWRRSVAIERPTLQPLATTWPELPRTFAGSLLKAALDPGSSLPSIRGAGPSRSIPTSTASSLVAGGPRIGAGVPRGADFRSPFGCVRMVRALFRGKLLAWLRSDLENDRLVPPRWPPAPRVSCPFKKYAIQLSCPFNNDILLGYPSPQARRIAGDAHARPDPAGPAPAGHSWQGLRRDRRAAGQQDVVPGPVPGRAPGQGEPPRSTGRRPARPGGALGRLRGRGGAARRDRAPCGEQSAGAALDRAPAPGQSGRRLLDQEALRHAALAGRSCGQGHLARFWPISRTRSSCARSRWTARRSASAW